MNTFYMNGYLWRIVYVSHDDPMLIDITGELTVATTDWNTKTVYLSEELTGDFKSRVLIHELGHCALFSFGLIDEIHSMVYPEYWIDAEEWACNFIADYGAKIFNAAKGILGHNAWICIPKELEKLIA